MFSALAHLFEIFAKDEITKKHETLESIILGELTTSIAENNLEKLKQMVRNFRSHFWRFHLTEYGVTIFQHAIIQKNKDAFDFLLNYLNRRDLDTTNLFSKTALMFALENNATDESSEDISKNEYFATQLINKGASINRVDSNRESCLNKAIRLSSVTITEILLERGINKNLQDADGNTALHKALTCNSDPNIDELISMLLYYEADPFIENSDEYIPFEFAIKFNHSLAIQKTLLDYTFDESTTCNVHLEILIQLAKDKSPIFKDLFKYNINFLPCHFDNIIEDYDMFDFLFTVDIDYLEILVEHCSLFIQEILDGNKSIFSKGSLYRRNFESLTSTKCITNMNLLLESSLKECVLEFIRNLSSEQLYALVVCKNSEKEATQILTFFLSYGLDFFDSAYDIVYQAYGYCDLFKFLLHIGKKTPELRNNRNIMSTLISDVTLDLDKILEFPRVLKCFFMINTRELFNYFGDPDLGNKLKNKVSLRSDFSDDITSENRFPLLVELARNTFRKYVVNHYKMTSASQFYTFINSLPISHIHKKIITYETKLYHQ